MTALDGATGFGDASAYPANAGEFAARWNGMEPADRDQFTRRLVNTAHEAVLCAREHGPLTPADEWDARFQRDVQQLARFMQTRDAQQFGVQKDGVWTPTWEDSGEAGQQEYMTDAAAVVSALSALGWAPIERKS